ncbi:MAG: enolase C-terminal domain-like protein [Gemmatimonadaceae bacterium]
MPAAIRSVSANAYRVPTDAPESDGTLEWDSTTLVVVEVQAAGESAIGYTYSDAAAAMVIGDRLAPLVLTRDAMHVESCWRDMTRAVRNIGIPGIAAAAISAVDSALWQLKANLLGIPLTALLGVVHEGVPVYGSGGFTSYSIDRLQAQLAGWVEQGIPRVKMKVGREPNKDVERVRAAREAIGPGVELFVDANGAYGRKQALALAERFTEFDVRWFEEPVPSDDLDGLRFIRDRAPSTIEIAAGEYGYDLSYFRRMLDAGAVDVLQADATRCLGITGLLQVAALCDAYNVGLSTHTAPLLHLPAAAAIARLAHLEYFHDHVRIEDMLFDDVVRPRSGMLHPADIQHGPALRKAVAQKYAV